MSSQSHSQKLRQSLSAVGLAPGSTALIPEDFDPSTELHVSFGDKAVSLGNLLRASECKSAPSISFAPESNGIDSSTSYTLLLVDPDAPTPDDPKFAYWRHWVVSGLKPSPISVDADSKELAVFSKPALTEYLGPGPKDDSHPHRYLFLLFREPQGLSLSKENVGGEQFTDRRSFQMIEWILQHDLKLVGVNWMLGAGDGWSE